MNTTRLWLVFLPLPAIYSLLVFISYRPLTRPAGVRLSQATSQVETTTGDERSRGQSSFVIRQERRLGITRKGFFLLAVFGYIALSVGFTVTSILVSR
jgi:hypothetical protein